MRTLLATVVLVPSLALAQVDIPPPTAPRPTRPLRPFAAQRQQAQQGTAEQPGQGPAPAPAPGPRGAPAPTPPPAGARGAAPGAGPQRGEVLRTTDSKCVPLKGRFMLSFNKVDITDILEQASRWTCRNFVYTEDVVRGKITLLSKTPVTADEAYAAFLAALNANNIAVYATGKYYKLIRTADSKKNPIPTYTDEKSGTPANEQPVTKVIRLQYVDADQMRGVVANFLSAQGADVQAIPPDMLIVTDIGLNIRRIERIMEAVDRQGGGDLVRIVQIRYASAKDIADKINQIFQAQGGRGARRTVLAPGAAGPRGAPAAPAVQAAGGGVEVSVTKILADDRTNKLIVIADEKSFQRILELIEQLDVPTSGEGGIHVVFLRNANAEELAQTLSSLAQGQATKRAPGQPAVPPTAPGMPARPPTPPAAAGAAGAETAELFAGEVKITADKAQNALLIQASSSDFNAMKRLIDTLDRPRRQVFVEAVIVEVNLRNELQLGVGAHAAVPFTYKGETGVLPIVSAPGRLNSTTLGSSAGILSALSLGGFLTGFAGPVTAELKDFGIPSIGALIQALQTNSDVNVLSTPHLVAVDNEDSEIAVGQNVPFQAGYAPSGLSSLLSAGSTGTSAALGTAAGLGGLGSLYAPIQRQNVELRLKIKPQINEGGAVRLTIDEQTEEIASQDPQLGPTTAKRSVKTMVVAKDQSTIVLGGLIQERTVRSVRKVPFFGSLPLIGWLFRDSDTTKQKTNLLLFLTPYIIRNEDDYRRIFEKKRKEQQEFVEQFYGRQPEFKIDIDFSRKAGPYSHLRSGVLEESSKIENGGPGGPNERVTHPGDRSPATAPAPTPAPGAGPGAPPEEGTPVDQLEVQPEVPSPGVTPPPQPPAPTPPPTPPETAPPAEGAPAPQQPPPEAPPARP